MKRKLFRVKTTIFVWQKWVYFLNVSIFSFFSLILLEGRPEKNLFCSSLYSIISVTERGNITQKNAFKNRKKSFSFFFFFKAYTYKTKENRKENSYKTFPASWLESESVSCSVISDSENMDCSLPGSSVHGILQARILEWVAISFFRGSSQPRYRTCISCDSCILSTFFIPLFPEPSREAQIL